MPACTFDKQGNGFGGMAMYDNLTVSDVLTRDPNKNTLVRHEDNERGYGGVVLDPLALGGVVVLLYFPADDALAAAHGEAGVHMLQGHAEGAETALVDAAAGEYNASNRALVFSVGSETQQALRGEGVWAILVRSVEAGAMPMVTLSSVVTVALIQLICSGLTQYNQYESMILPMIRYLESFGVQFHYNTKVVNRIRAELIRVTECRVLRGNSSPHVLFSDKPGNFVKKKMRDCTGKEICMEWLYHMGVPEEEIENLAGSSANTIPFSFVSLACLYL